VGPNKKESRHISHRNWLGAGEAFDGEKRLVLLRRQPRFMGGRLAECQKFSKLIAKLGKHSVIDGPRFITLRRSFVHKRFVLLPPHSVPSEYVGALH
jgi:hypothetical protein